MLQWDAIRRSLQACCMLHLDAIRSYLGACCNVMLLERVYGHVAMGCYEKEFRGMLLVAIGCYQKEFWGMLQWDAIIRSIGACCNGMLSEGV